MYLCQEYMYQNEIGMINCTTKLYTCAYTSHYVNITIFNVVLSSLAKRVLSLSLMPEGFVINGVRIWLVYNYFSGCVEGVKIGMLFNYV